MIDDILGLGEVCMLEKELKFLILKNGKKVDHPETGDVTHNDMADCVSTVCVNLLSDQVEALGEGTLLRITGAAQGGYMPEVGMRENLAKEQFYFERSMEFERQMGLTDGWAGRPWGGGL